MGKMRDGPLILGGLGDGTDRLGTTDQSGRRSWCQNEKLQINYHKKESAYRIILTPTKRYKNFSRILVAPAPISRRPRDPIRYTTSPRPLAQTGCLARRIRFITCTASRYSWLVRTFKITTLQRQRQHAVSAILRMAIRERHDTAFVVRTAGFISTRTCALGIPSAQKQQRWPIFGKD